MLTLVRSKKMRFCNNALTSEMLTNDLVSYTQKIAAVTDYCVRLENKNLPSLRKSDWITTEVMEKFSSARATGRLWLNNGILDSLKYIPETIINYDDLYQLSEKEIITCLKAIIDTPGLPTEEIKTRLAGQILRLAREISNMSISTKSVLANMTDFKVRTNNSTKFFQEIYVKAVDSKTADETKVKEINAIIKELNEQIKHINNSMIAMGVIDGVSMIALIILLVLSSPANPLILLQVIAGGVAVAALIASLALNEVIAVDTRKVLEKEAELNDYTYDLLQLSYVVTAFEELNIYVAEATTAITGILTLWNELEADLRGLAKAIKSETTHIDKEEYKEILEEMTTSEEEWKKIVKIATTISIINLKPTDLSDINIVTIAK